VNLLLLRVDLSGDPTVRELVQRVRAAALDAYANRTSVEFQTPSLWPSALARTTAPVAEVAFNFVPTVSGINDESRTIQGTEIDLQTFAPEVRRRTWVAPPLWFGAYLMTTLWPGPDGAILGRLDYNRSMLSDRVASTLAATFSRLLRTVALAPDSPVSELHRQRLPLRV
jgi:hypothetical protein